MWKDSMKCGFGRIAKEQLTERSTDLHRLSDGINVTGM